MDRRRSRWFAMDVHFFDGNLCHAILDRYGPAGVVVFTAFLAACKRNSTPGRIAYGTPADALSIMGIPNLALIDANGNPWSLEDLWKTCAHHKVTTRQKRNRLTYVICSKWADWQQDATKPDATRDQPATKPKTGKQKPRSEGSNGPLDTTGQDTTATGHSRKRPGLTPEAEPLAARLANACTGENRRYVEREAREVVEHLLRYVSSTIVEKSVGNAEKSKTLTVPRAIVGGISRDMAKLNINVPLWFPKAKAS